MINHILMDCNSSIIITDAESAFLAKKLDSCSKEVMLRSMVFN